MSALRTLALVGLVTAASLALAELFLRLFAPVGFSTQVDYLPDPHVAFRLEPSRTYRLPEGGVCTINALGYRGPEVAVPKPPGVFRIVALGGSSTFCYLTDDARIWVRGLERELRGGAGPAIELVNVAAPGYSSFESKILYQYKLRDLEPDAAIVYHTWNDMKLFRGLEEHGELRKAVYRASPWKAFLKQFQLAWRVRLLLRPAGPLAPREERWVEVDPELAIRIPEGGAAHRFARHNYEDLALLLRSDGVLPIFASQAGLLHEENLGDPEVRRRVYTEFQGLDYEEILRQWGWMSRTIAEVARRHRAVFVDVRGAVPGDLEHFRDHVHLTERGNAAVARAFARELRQSSRFRAALARSDARRTGGAEELPIRPPQEQQADGGVEEHEEVVLDEAEDGHGAGVLREERRPHRDGDGAKRPGDERAEDHDGQVGEHLDEGDVDAEHPGGRRVDEDAHEERR